jgi:mannan endo-1,4-beta-mannosidase
MRRSTMVVAAWVITAALAVGSAATSEAAAARRPPRAATTSPPAGQVWVSNGSLTLNGAKWRPVGFDAFQAATWWATNVGCGAQIDNLDTLMQSVPPNGLVRLNAFQALGVNVTTHQLDFTGIDRVVAAAARNGRKLSMILAAQDGTCDDGHWRDESWYRSGYMQAFDDLHRGVTPLSYWNWIHAIVARYQSNTAIAMWVPVGEPEPANCQANFTGSRCWDHSTCPTTASTTLRAFFDTIGRELHRVDPNHLVAAGLIGGGQCGSAGAEYGSDIASTGIDLATFHDYGADATAVPSILRYDLSLATAANKPLIVEEAGIKARDMPGCLATSTRATLLYNKLIGQLGAGAQGFAAWDWSANDPGTCDLYIRPGDPFRALYGTWGAIPT